MPMQLAIKNAPFNVPNALSRRISAIISQDIDPVAKHIYPQFITPIATRKDPNMLVIVPIHASIIIPCRDRC
jgi:hypothetical protein